MLCSQVLPRSWRCSWIASACSILPGFTHVVAYDWFSFLKIEYFSSLCIHYILLIHSFVDGHLGSLPPVDFVINDVMTVAVQISV